MSLLNVFSFGSQLSMSLPKNCRIPSTVPIDIISNSYHLSIFFKYAEIFVPYLLASEHQLIHCYIILSP